METTLQAHPVADLIPSMSAEEYEALKADLALHGQREPIILFEGKILDGRNRYRACCDLGIEPATRDWDKTGLAIDFVLSENLSRRHLDPGQRAVIAVQADAMRKAELAAKERQRAQARRNQPQAQKVECLPPSESVPKAKARDEVAKQLGTNPRYVQDAKTIRDAAPELLEQVKQRKLTLPQAKQECQRQQKLAAMCQRAAQAEREGVGGPAWNIVHGDCVDILPTLPEKARLIFADPPYNLGIDYGEGQRADRLEDAQYLAWVEKWLAACRDVLTPDGALWVLIGDEYAAEYGVTLKRLGLTIRSWIKWREAFGVRCARNFGRCSRHLFYCVRDPRHFVFNGEAVTRPSDRQAKYGDKRAAPGGKLWENVWGVEPPIPRLTGTCHERIPDFPTQLPLKLLEPIVLCASDPGDLVIDPFNGSGTTGVAAIRHGRRYLGIEKSAKFVESARLRLKGIDRADHALKTEPKDILKQGGF